MLGTIVFLACIGAAGFIGFIGFVLFGPVPVNRKVTIVSRIQPEPMPTAALPIQLEAPIVVPPAAPPAVTSLEIAPEHVIRRPDGTPFPPRQNRLQADGPIIQPTLRRRGDAPTPAPRQRMARGTEGPARPRATFDSVAVTTPAGSAFDAEERTFIDPSQLS